MASPNYSELLATTLSYYKDEIVDNISEKVAYLMYLRDKGHIKKVAGGNDIVQPLEYAENGTYQRMQGWQKINVTPSDVISAATYDWKQICISVAMSGLELLKNASSKQQIFDLMKAKVKNAEHTFDNSFGYDLHSDGTADGGKQVGGLQAAVISTDTGTYGGIDRTAFAFWTNQQRSCLTDGGAAASASTIVSNMDALWLSHGAYKHRPKAIFFDGVFFGYYESAIHPLQRINDSKLADLGFDAYKYKGVPVIHDPDNPASTGYFLDPEYLYLVVHKDRDMEVLGGNREPVDQDGVIKIMGWAGNMTCSNQRAQGILSA